jgi:putative ABC transport system permease protein
MTFQFFASMVLISSSVIIFNQLEFIQNKGLGFDREEVLVIPVKNRGELNPKFEDLQSELLKIPGVKFVGATSNIPGRSFNQNAVFPTNDPQRRVNTSEAMIDYNFFETLNIELAEGRFFNRENAADKDAFIINETAARHLFNSNALGKEITWERDRQSLTGRVIGIVKDFNYQSLHETVRPLVFRLIPDYNYVLIKIETNSLDQILTSIQTTWKKFDDRFGFEYSFLRDQVNQQYTTERNMSGVMITFAVLAAVIACIGLLGMAALSFRQKIKEVSVRKILGATLSQLAGLLLREFTITMIIAILLAVPFTFWIMNDWLQNFAFRTRINPMVFVGSGVLLLGIAWTTLSYLTIKVAGVNPAETLKAE